MEAATETTPSETTAPSTHGAATAEVIEVRKPADGSLLQTVPVDSPKRVAEVVARVRAAQPEWEAIGFAGRRHWLGKLRGWLVRNDERLAGLMEAAARKGPPDAELAAPLIARA